MMPERSYATGPMGVQRLLAMGFSELEVARLTHMKEHITEQIEYREMLEQSRRLDFMRWLVEHDRLGQ